MSADLIELIKVLQLRAEQCDRGNWYVSLSEMHTILAALAAKDTALSEMRAELERCHERLEIDHYYVMVGEDKLERREVPWAGRADGVDGIEARDATISLQDARIAKLEAQLERARKALEPFAREAAQWCHDGTWPDDYQPSSTIITLGDLRAAARAASQDEGEER